MDPNVSRNEAIELACIVGGAIARKEYLLVTPSTVADYTVTKSGEILAELMQALLPQIVEAGRKDFAAEDLQVLLVDGGWRLAVRSEAIPEGGAWPEFGKPVPPIQFLDEEVIEALGDFQGIVPH